MARHTDASAAIAAVCGVCNLNLTQTQQWPGDRQVFHCQGQSKAGAPHHHPKPTWGNCWKCGGPLGCARCNGRSLEEALCRRCGVWGTKEALVHQGLLGGQRVEDYPPEWREAYVAEWGWRLQGTRRAQRDGDSA